MTKKEWIERCAARYMWIGGAGVTQEIANTAAEKLFALQDGEFSELADYSPERCADEDAGFYEKGPRNFGLLIPTGCGQKLASGD